MYRTFMTWQFPAQLENGILVEASAGSASDDRADLAARWSRDVSVVSALRALELVAAPDRLLIGSSAALATAARHSVAVGSSQARQSLSLLLPPL